MSARVLVAMSGGVDSSVAAGMLQRMGYAVEGLTFQLDSSCSFKGDPLVDSARVCDHLGIVHHVMDLSAPFREQVQQDFVDNYLQGMTPNPCVVCNRRIKWEYMLRKADELGIEHVATGHYVRVTQTLAGPQLLRGVEARKDQSYALWRITPSALRRTLLPLGTLSKSEVRALALELDLPVAQKGESQDICFVPDGEYREFLREFAPRDTEHISPGEIIGPEGNVVGRHHGLPYYTVGQRRGLHVALGKPVYVVELDVANNQLLLAWEEGLRRPALLARDANWLIDVPAEPLHCLAAIRYHDIGTRALVRPLAAGELRVEFDQPRRAIAPGQSVVFYEGERLLGGAVIQQALREEQKA